MRLNSFWFLVLFMAIGFGILGYGLWMMKRSGEAAYWPITPGKLVECNLREHVGTKGSRSYEVMVKYEYAVAGQNYTSTRLAYGYDSSNSREPEAEIYETLKGAQRIEVRYDPADPASAVLSYGTHRSIKLTLAFAGVWLAFMLGVCFLWWLSAKPDHVLLQNLMVR